MPTLKQLIFTAVLVFSVVATAAAQDSLSAQRSSLTITATAVDDRVRVTAPSSVVQMRLEVYATSGEKLFDQEIRGGNVFDWHLQNGQAQRLPPSNYVCVVTAKSVSGKLTQKIGAVSIEEKSASLQPAESKQLSAAQSQTIGPVEENSSWTVSGQDEPQTPTVIAHDGTDGQMIRGRGALTFRIGDFFSGVDKEQMRLTEEGNLGIGTSEPKATLDVAGTIRAQRVLIAKPNRPAGDLKAQVTDDVDSAQPLASGTGTQDRIAKWTDNAGTLGDSGITETAGGFVGIGTTTPGSKLVVSANTATLPPASGVARFADADGGQTAVFADAFSNNAIFNVRRANGTAANPSALQANQLIGVIGASGYGASAYMGTRARVAFWASEMWTNSANGTYVTFNTTANGTATPGGSERVRIDNAGNVGIGMTPDPNIKLDVNGSTRITPGNGYSISLGAPNGDTGMTLLKPGISRADVRFNGTTLSLLAGLGVTPPCCGIVINTAGNVGIGTSAPAVRLHVNGDIIMTTAPGKAIQLGTPNAETGMSIIKTNVGRADLRLGDDGVGNRRLTLALGADTGPPDPNNGIVIYNNNVGIGLLLPAAKLDVVGGSNFGIQATSDAVGVVGNVFSNNGGSIGVAGGAIDGTGVLGTSTNNAGVVGYSENDTGLVARSTNGFLVAGFPSLSQGVRTFHINLNGTYVAGSDFAESLPVRGDKSSYEPGDVLVVTARAAGAVEKSREPYDVRVVGVYSTRPGVLGAEKNGATRIDPGEVPVAIVGIVPTKVSAMNGPIRVGDLLTTSSTPGHAMRCANRAKCVGAIVGKALEPLAGGKGIIKVLVMLR